MSYISWILGFAGTLLLPYDISIALVDHEKSSTLMSIWKTIYWMFVLFKNILLDLVTI